MDIFWKKIHQKWDLILLTAIFKHRTIHYWYFKSFQ